MRARDGHIGTGRARHGPTRALLGLAMYFLGALAPVAPSAAQTITGSAQTPAPRLGVPTRITGTAASQVAFAIEFGPAGIVPPKSFVRIRGLPAAVSLTEGYTIAPGAWAVPLHAVAALAANLPTGQGGQSVVTIQLVGVDGTVLAQAETVLAILPAQAQPSAAQSPQGDAKARLPDLAPEERLRAEKMLAQGEKFLQSGNIAVARQFFQRAAEAGLADGALQLAATYDAHELGRLAAKGVVASPEEARKWYRRARELGAREADERLARLDGK